MILVGTGVGLTSAPATASIMAVVPLAKAGVGSAINDTTRLIGATLGVAIIGSVYASLYNSRLTQALPASVPSALARAAHGSVGAAIQIVKNVDRSGHPALAAQIHQAASDAFFHGFSVGCLVAAGVSAVGAITALALLPAIGTYLPTDEHESPLQPVAATQPRER
jgi:hypothetical protein